MNDVGEAAVAQDAGDAEEDLVLHAVHALRGEGVRWELAGGEEHTRRRKWQRALDSPHLDQRGHRVHLVHVLQDALHQVGHRHADGPGSVALQLDDLVGSAAQDTQRGTILEVKGATSQL